jgi:hypothetical protein
MRLREYWERFWFSLWFHLDPDAKDIVALGIAISSYDPKEGEV